MPAYAVISVAAGNIVTVESVSLSVLFVGHLRLDRRQRIQLDVVRFVDDLSTRRIPGRIKVFGNRGLAISHHRLTGELLRVDEESVPSFPRDYRPIMGMTFMIHPLAKAHRPKQVDRSGLQDAGPNPAQHMLATLPLKHDAIDPALIEDMGQKQSGRPAADDCHLGSHSRFHV